MTEPTVEEALKMVVAEHSPAAVPQICPPHHFVPSWAAPYDGMSPGEDNTVPAMLCQHCGEVRAMRVQT